MRRSLMVLVLGLAFPLTAQAQVPAEPAPATTPVNQPPAAATPPAEPAPAAPAPITFGWDALVDVYYLYNFTGDPKTQAPAGRQFDTTANNFALNYAKLGVQAQTDIVGFRLDLGAGHAASIINASSAATSTASPSIADSLYGSGLLLQQAYVTVKPLPQLSIDAGKFVTSAGAEVIEANKNWLYSRSLLFYGIPLLHTGLRINVAPTPELTLSLQVVNGWNNDPDINAHKTFGANLTYANPAIGLLASATTYLGKEGGLDADKTRIVADGMLTKTIGRLSLGLNLDYVKLGDAHWFGMAGMGRFIVNGHLTLALRGEYLKSKNGLYLPVDGALYEMTGMAAWTVANHYELRAELRTDLSDQEIFTKGTTPRKNQVTGLLAALAYF